MEKKAECEIVQDLLLGYVDDTLNQESKKLVEKHLSKCVECKNKFEMIKKDIESNDEIQNKEVDYLKKIRRKVNKKNKLLIFLGILLVLIVVFNIIVFANYFLQSYTLRIYLNNNITEEQIKSIIESIQNEDNEAEINYYSKEEALNKMKENLGEKAYLLDEYGKTEDNPFSEYLEIITNFNKIDDIEYLCLSMDEVKKIQNEKNYNPYILFLDRFGIVNKILELLD